MRLLADIQTLHGMSLYFIEGFVAPQETQGLGSTSSFLIFNVACNMALAELIAYQHNQGEVAYRLLDKQKLDKLFACLAV